MKLPEGQILKGMSIKELEQFFTSIGEPRYRGEQAFRRINKEFETNLDNFSEFPQSLRQKLKEWNILPRLTINEAHQETKNNSSEKDTDKTEKIIFNLDSTGHRQKRLRQVETVWITHPQRRTVCISSQLGCSLSCSFCATGTLDFRGNLHTWEILEQVYEFIRRRSNEKITNIVFMGMGEPFHNYDNVIRAARILHHPKGLQLGASHITISTAGVIPSIERFTREREPFNLAISLNHSISEERSSIMNINKKFPLEHLLKTCRLYTKELNKRITFEYVMIPEINMHNKARDQLIRIARSVRCRINLIPLNTTLQGWRRPNYKESQDFQSSLLDAGISVFNRGSPGLKINAACGMLALKTSQG